MDPRTNFAAALFCHLGANLDWLVVPDPNRCIADLDVDQSPGFWRAGQHNLLGQSCRHGRACLAEPPKRPYSAAPRDLGRFAGSDAHLGNAAVGLGAVGIGHFLGYAGARQRDRPKDVVSGPNGLAVRRYGPNPPGIRKLVKVAP